MTYNVCDAMKMMRQSQKLIVFLCLAAVLFTAFGHAGGDLPILVLAAVWILFGLKDIPAALVRQPSGTVPAAPILPVCSPRPPPIR